MDELLVTIAGASRTLSPSSHHVVGRRADAEITVDHPLVSRDHVRLSPSDGGWIVEDLGSRNGVYVDGQRITRLAVGPAGLTLHLGEPPDGPRVELHPIAAATPTAAPTPAPGPDRPEPRPPSAELGRLTMVHTTGSGVVTIGRDPAGDIVVDDLLVSRHHAEIRREPGEPPRIVDLGSHNGTFVNGRKIRHATLEPLDLVAVGRTTFRYTEAGLEEYVETGDVSFAALGLRVVTKTGFQLLDGVSFSLDEASLLGVVGPSGSGKSTLLGAITGLRPPTEGAVFYGGRDLFAHYEDIRQRIGYVPQDDLVQPELTVGQSLDYAARLRFPADVPDQERTARVAEVMVELGIDHRRDVRVRDLSGGQRKRVTVATELLTKPSLLFLDEPTSGLDPGTERDVMRLLRELADGGRTVVVVTHSVDSLKLCDRILCLATGGRTAYFGPPQFAMTYFGAEDYQEVFHDLSAHPDADWKGRYEAHEYHDRYVHQPLSHYQPARDAPRAMAPPQAGSWFRQVTTLTARYMRVIMGDQINLFLLLVAAPAFGLMMAIRMPTGQFDELPPGEFRLLAQSPLILFTIAIGLTQLAAGSAVREIVREIAIFKRERAVGLSVSAYLTSKVVVLSTLGLLQSTIVVVAIMLRQGGLDEGVVLSPGRLELIIVATLTWIGAMAMSLLVSAIVGQENRVVLLLPAVMGFHMMVSSAEVFPVSSVPALDAAGVLSTTQWGFAAMASTANLNDLQVLNNVARDLPTFEGSEETGRNPLEQLGADLAAASQDPRLTEATGNPRFNHEPRAWWSAVIAIVAITAALLMATALALRRHDFV